MMKLCAEADSFRHTEKDFDFAVNMTADDAFRVMKYNLDPLLKMAENYDMSLTIEPHGIYSTNAEELLRLMSLFDSKRLAINFDTGNVTIAGNDSVETLMTAFSLSNARVSRR
jgi:sugar phosphate isomerase/epimerase